jgi:hypothetical protein
MKLAKVTQKRNRSSENDEKSNLSASAQVGNAPTIKEVKSEKLGRHVEAAQTPVT